MAYLIPFKFENFDMSNGFYLTKNNNEVYLIAKIKTQTYDRQVIYPCENQDDSDKIIIEFTDKNIENIIYNLDFYNTPDNKLFPINDKVTISEIKTNFAPKKLQILKGQKLYDEILEKDEEYFTAFLKLVSCCT